MLVKGKGYQAVTARIEISFKKPTRIGEKVNLKGQVKEEKGRIIKTYAEIEQNGEITASAQADFLIQKTKT